MLPSACNDSVGALIAPFRSSIPSPPIPLFTLRRAPRGTQRKTRGRAVRYSFLVRLFHSLLRAGLSRRSITLLLRYYGVVRPWLPRRYFRPHGSPACTFSLTIASQVLKFRTKAQMRFTPPIHRTPHGQ